MGKRKKRTNGLSNIINKIGIVLLVAILLIGCYFYLKRENKLPSSLNNIEVEKLWNKTKKESKQIRNDLIDKIEEGLESAKTSIEKGKESAQEEAKVVNEKGNSSRHNSSKNTKDKDNEASSKLETGSLNLKLEIPVATRTHDEIILKRFAYTTSYSKKMKNPNWVAWELTRKEIQGKQERNDRFIPDPDLPEPKARTSDYTNTGYDRGHMAPAADMKWSSRAMDESFYMSNICPQQKTLNRGDWNDLEDACRVWAKRYGTVYIACGPIYDRAKPKRIGTNKIAVPDRFFKVVLIYNRKDPMAFGFIFPNVAHSQDLDKYQVTVDDIENITGFDFFSKLPDHIEDYIEAEIRPLPPIRK